MKDPNEEELEENHISTENFTTYSINTFKGIILRTFFQYAFYLAQSLNLSKSNRMAPEVEEKLNELLNPEIESVKIIRSIIALNLPGLFYLHEDWTSTKIPIIFPLGNKDLWKIAWESYISYNNLNARVYRKLKEQYKIAINDYISILSGSASENLVYHIILLYVNEIEDLDEDSIIKLFFTLANTDLRSRAMWSTIKIYDSSKNTDDGEKFLKKILEIWEYRIIEAKNNQDLSLKDKYDEFHWFGLLFEKIDIERLYLQLLLEILDLTEGQLDVFTHRILELLKRYAEPEPENVLNVISKLLKSKVLSWLYSNTENTIIEIIEIINEKYDLKEFHPIIEEIAEILIDKGYYEIRNLNIKLRD